MKSKYAIVFGILGAIIGISLLYSWLILIASILFMTYGDYCCPQWFDAISSGGIGLVLIVVFTAGGLIAGAIFGAKKVVTFKNARIWFLSALIISVLFIVLVLARIGWQKHYEFSLREKELAKGRITAAIGKIKAVNVAESQENLKFIISTQAAFFGKYELSLVFDTDFAKNFLVYSKRIFINKPENKIEATFAISDLEVALRKGMAEGGRINSFEQRFGAQDEFLVKITLRPLDAPIKLEDVKIVQGKMNYLCYKYSCEFTKIADRYFKLEKIEDGPE